VSPNSIDYGGNRFGGGNSNANRGLASLGKVASKDQMCTGLQSL
jgi:hypothetical protein